MKPHTIVTLEGIYTLNRDGFYVRAEEREPKASGLWLTIGGVALFIALGIAGWEMFFAG